MNIQKTVTSDGSKLSQVVEIYQGLTRLANMAAYCIAEKKHEERSQISEKMILALVGLRSSLLKDKPEAIGISMQLEKYYDYMIDLIVKMNLKNDGKICQHLIHSFSDMAKCWAEVKSQVHL